MIDDWLPRKAAGYWAAFLGSDGYTQLSWAAMDHYCRVGLVSIGNASRTFLEWPYPSDLVTKHRCYSHLGGFDSEIGWNTRWKG